MEAKNIIKGLFVVRICLWIVALGSTIYWINYSRVLHSQGIYAPEEYSPLFRPVFYTCLIITIAAICLSFFLHSVGKKLKKKNNL
ncbi:MAG: hypothetical protein E7302_09455 [Butyrivibrio sp.]|nr:hypothetical protein [Butyrivibrio sp.]